MKYFKYIFALAIFASCSAPTAVYDYDQKASFNTINTYKIYPDLVSRMSQLDEKRLLAVLETELPSEGLTFSENPDIYVNFYTSEYETASGNNIGIGVGGGGGNVGVGVSGGFPIGGPDTYLRLTLDFIDAKNDALIWQAVVDGKFDKNATPQNRETQLRIMVLKALNGYPPKK